jgi:hypothetical protein
MFSTKLMTTAQTPSRFALPTCGHAFLGASLRGTDLGVVAGAGTAAVKRERIATQITGGMGFVPAYVPGTTAWSPPTS